MPKYDLIEEEIKWCEAHRNPEQQVFQDGFISGLRHALFLMKSRPTQAAPDGAGCAHKNWTEVADQYYCYDCDSVIAAPPVI